MVRAILAGRKTMTRRTVRDQSAITDVAGGGVEPTVWWPRIAGKDLACPYGAPGHRLWVRETWYDDMLGEPATARERFDDGRVGGIEYRATHECTSFEAGCPCNPDGDGKRSEWRPSIFMPRWASRITLEVTEVRVERLQGISEEDARAEGISKPVGSQFWHSDVGKQLPGETPQWAFRNLWDSINAERAPWSSNPWVWIVGFKRVEVQRDR